MSARSKYDSGPTPPPYNLYIDIETEPREDASDYMPTSWPMGNLKDPEKIKAATKEKEAEWLSKAALKALTGRVLVVGYAQDDDKPDVIEGDEGHVIRIAMDMIQKQLAKGTKVLGYNIAGFDMPFLIQRAWANGISVPKTIWGLWRDRFQLHDGIVDLMAVVMAGNREFAGYSLGNVSKWFGLGSKTGDGARFGELYRQDKEAALAYVKQDIELTRALAYRVGLV